MTTFIVETGTVISGANTYVTVSGVNTYASDYGYDTWLATTSGIREQSLRKAMRYVDNLNFRGIRQTVEQQTAFPRSELVDNSGYLLDENTIPTKVINAVCEASILFLPDSTVNLQPNITKKDFKTGSQITGVIQDVWNITRNDIRNRSTIIEDMLREYLKNKIIVEIQRG